MDTIQEKHERAVGDAFIAWYNERHGTSYTYCDRGTDAPDLIYKDGPKILPLEITAGYYDAGHAIMLWQNARDIPGAPDSWSSRNPNQKLVDSVTLALTKKCGKAYPSGCVLLVVIYPDLTDAEEFSALISEIAVPNSHPFTEIYVGGLFPVCSNGSAGGRCWWALT